MKQTHFKAKEETKQRHMNSTKRSYQWFFLLSLSEWTSESVGRNCRQIDGIRRYAAYISDISMLIFLLNNLFPINYLFWLWIMDFWRGSELARGAAVAHRWEVRAQRIQVTAISIENESPRSVEEGKSLLSVDIWKGTMVGGGLLLMNPRRRTVKENK